MWEDQLHTLEHESWLEEFGRLSTSMLMRRLKCTREYALLIMQSIVDNSENVYFNKDDAIVISGRELKK